MFLSARKLKVIELANWAAAPLATTLLGSLGAEVIKIEALKGDPLRGLLSMTSPSESEEFNYFWELTNHNKKSMAVDLSDRRGREIIYDLVKSADVFVTNFRNPALVALGMEYETLAQVNNRLVYAHMSAFGEVGPDKNRPGFDETGFWAASGNLESLGEPDASATTLHAMNTMGDSSAGMHLVAGIALALLAREYTGRGQKVGASLLGAGIWAGNYRLQAACLSKEHVVRKVSRKEAANPLYNLYQTSDRRWLIFTMPDADHYWEPFCRVLGLSHLAGDKRFQSIRDRFDNRVALIEVIDRVLATKTLAEWTDLLRSSPVAWAPVLDSYEAVAAEQALANDFVEIVPHPTYGPMKMITVPIQMSAAPRSFKRAPELGEHTEEILLEMGFDWESIMRLREVHVIIT